MLTIIQNIGATRICSCALGALSNHQDIQNDTRMRSWPKAPAMGRHIPLSPLTIPTSHCHLPFVGEHLVPLKSPALYSAQSVLFLSLRLVKPTFSDPPTSTRRLGAQQHQHWSNHGGLRASAVALFTGSTLGSHAQTLKRLRRMHHQSAQSQLGNL